MTFSVDAFESDTNAAQIHWSIGNPKFKEMKVNIHATYDTHFVYERDLGRKNIL